MDKKVYITFGLTIIIILSFLIPRLLEADSCKDLNFAISKTRVETGELISFYDNTNGAKNWNWNFGDEMGTSTAQRAEYTYNKPGTYYVQLTVNNNCTETRQLEVVEVIDPIKPSGGITAKIQAPTSVKVNQSIQFNVHGKDISSYEWSFGESGETDSKEPNPTYTYQEPGIYTVNLMVNGRNDILVKHRIEVKKDNTHGSITEEEFRSNLQNRVDYNIFKRFICNNNELVVTINGNENLGFYHYYQQLRIMSDINVSRVRLIRNKNNGCITAIHVTQQ